SSPSGSAAKISASSDAGRCWLNLPHTIGKSNRPSCIVPPMDEPESGGRAVDRHVTGPLSADAASALLDRGAGLIEAGEFGEALATYQRGVGHDNPDVTATALPRIAPAR